MRTTALVILLGLATAANYVADIFLRENVQHSIGWEVTR
jgi:hypothetical protein